MDTGEAYTVRAEALMLAAERRSRVVETITHRVRAGDLPDRDDPEWGVLDDALRAEDEAREAMRAFLDGRRLGRPG